MNKHILTVIDNQLNPGKYTQEELDKNAAYAAAATYATSNAADADVANAAADVAYATYATYWLNRYFRLSGE
ncbi:MAG: hypothetical protein GY829_11540, partial [Gammaproteobacteria bacterium]|nr:hypothetical protein [Gammaproteobacteria bacterium]